MKHCLHRIPPSVDDIAESDIMETQPGVYTVAGSHPLDTYAVRLSSLGNPDVPSCECEDWRRHGLPCKHLLRIMMCHEGNRSWDCLPQFYRNLPLLNLDYNICQCDRADAASIVTAHDTESTVTAAEQSPSAHQQRMSPALVVPPQVLSDDRADVEGNMSDSSDATVAYDVPDSVWNAAKRNTAQSNTMCDDNVNPQNARAYVEMQRQVRQVLNQLVNCTYTIDNVQFLQTSLSLLRQQLQAFKSQSTRRLTACNFRRDRRLVRLNIRASQLRRRLAVIRARRRMKRSAKDGRRRTTTWKTLTVTTGCCGVLLMQCCMLN